MATYAYSPSHAIPGPIGGPFVSEEELKLKEFNIYGSSRIGLTRRDEVLTSNSFSFETFDGNSSGWTGDLQGAVALITDNKLEVTTTAANQYVKDSFGATLHDAYTVSLDLDLITATTLKIIATDISGVEYPNSVIVNSSGNYSLEFTPTISAVSTIKVINLTAGTSRFKMDNVVIDKVTQNSINKYSYTKGERNFELTNHLGNVMSVVTDKKISVKGALIQENDFISSLEDWGPVSIVSFNTPGKIDISTSLQWDGPIKTINSGITAGESYTITVDVEVGVGFEGACFEMWDETFTNKLQGSWVGASGTYSMSYVPTSGTFHIKMCNGKQSGSEAKWSITNARVGETPFYEPNILSYSDYYPFGSLLPGRSANSSEYKYGFGGQEKDDEVNGVTGSSYTAEFWQYDSRLGRRWNVDPVDKPWESSYATFSNNPMIFVDPTGANPDFVESAEGDVYWDDNANSQETTKAGEKYLGKTLEFNFVSFIDAKSWDGPLGKITAGDKLSSTIKISAQENSKGELTGVSATKLVEIGTTPVGTGRDYYPGAGGSNNYANFSQSNKPDGTLDKYTLNFEQHSSVSMIEEAGLQFMGYKVVDVAQKLTLSISKGKLSVTSYTDVFPSAALFMNRTKSLMNYDQPSFKETHKAGTKLAPGLLPGYKEGDFSYYPAKLYKR
jgi:RHS repeat-associated protein